MSVRNIVKIDEEKCNGCGLCAKACAEGAIKIIDGKAKLISEIYCDGLGACLGHCPQDAITIEKRQAVDFDEEETKKHLAEEQKRPAAAKPGTKPHAADGFMCPGMMAKEFKPKQKPAGNVEASSQLGQWPVQLKLVPVNAPYFANADLLLTADCAPFAMGDFHGRFLKDHSIAIGCPKLDDVEFYIGKLAEILKTNKLNSLTVIHMTVPCCSGLTYIAQQAIAKSGMQMAFTDVTIGLQGDVLETKKM